MTTRSPSVLLVEDDAFTASLIVFLLGREAWSVEVVPHGRAAVSRITEGAPCDLVILEWLLPQVSGAEVLAHLGSASPWRHVPTLVLGASDDGDVIADVFEAGASDYVARPFDPKELLARLKRLLRATFINHDDRR